MYFIPVEGTDNLLQKFCCGKSKNAVTNEGQCVLSLNFN